MILVEVKAVGVYEGTLDRSIIRSVRIELMVDVLMTSDDMATVRLEEVMLVGVVVLTKGLEALMLLKVSE